VAHARTAITAKKRNNVDAIQYAFSLMNSCGWFLAGSGVGTAYH
jgi:hypothetical protein